MKSRLDDELTGQTRRFSDTPNFVSNIGLDYYLEDWKTTFGVNLNTVYGYSQSIDQLTATPGEFETVHTSFSSLNRLDLSIKTEISENFSLAFSATNILRPTDRRTIKTFDANGDLNGIIKTKEPSYSAYFIRGTYTW
ncbi:hypothetical protein ACFPLB_06495 [Aquamicrobium segne]|uniref:TonB-dependent receptor-like beta-barrel domain-containing protein n=1 Tax=Aquamicrobium segne TaxID=469547 RepID=A0ABW0GWK3_9HYPH